MYKITLQGLVLVMFLSTFFKSNGQDLYVIANDGRLFSTTARATCKAELIRLPCNALSAGDIAYYKDTLYYVSFGSLYRTILSDPAAPCTFLTFFPVALNALTVDSTGNVYVAGGNQLYIYKPSTGTSTFVGNFPTEYYSAGDLTFYKGELYWCANSYWSTNACLLKVNIKNPSLSTLFMNLKTQNVFGAITLPESCDSTGFYITSVNGSGTDLIEVDMVNKVELGVKCHFDFIVYGAAGVSEGGGDNKPIIDHIETKPACSDDGNNGLIKIIAANTGSTLTYYLNNSVSNKTGIFSNLAPGTYSIKILNELNCIKDTNVTVVSAISPSFLTHAFHPSCIANNGKIVAEPSINTVGLTYSINSGEYRDIGTFDSLPAGNYTVTAMTQSGCITQKNNTLVLPSIDIHDLRISVKNSTCDQLNGLISISAPYATAPLTYNLDRTIVSPNGTFTGLDSADYLLSVTDSSGCRFDTTVAITSTPLPIIDSIHLQSPCSDATDDGKIEVFTKNTNGALSYSINHSVSNQNGIFNHLAPGTYTISVVNEFNCRKDTVVVLIAGGVAQFSTILKHPVCSGNNGQITLRPSSPVSPLRYSVNGGAWQKIEAVKNLFPGTYAITAQNDAGCLFADTVHLKLLTINNAGITITSKNPVCSEANGSIKITVHDVMEPISFSLNETASDRGNFSNLLAGQYNLSIKDGNGCILDTSISLTTLPAVKIDSVKVHVACTNEKNNGRITIFSNRTNDGLKYAINNNINNTGVFFNLAAGSYPINISNKYGCATDTILQIESISSPTFSNTTIYSSCLPNSGIIAFKSIGERQLQFSVNGQRYQDTGTIENLSPGIYTINATNNYGCTTNKTTTLALPSINKGGIRIQTKGPGCNFKNGYINTTIQDLKEPVSYSLNGVKKNLGNFSDLSAASYHLTVADANYCSFDTLLVLQSEPIIKPNTLIDKKPASCPGSFDGTLSAIINGSQAPYFISINNAPFSSENFFRNLSAGEYRLTILNNKQCEVDSFITVIPTVPNAICSSIYFPTAFTPNKDGKNDVLKPTVFGNLEKYHFSVFNRFGQRVFESNDYVKGWNGTVNGSDPETGTFAWFSTYKFVGTNQQEHVQKGTVVLIR